jgi:hypothetical protein
LLQLSLTITQPVKTNKNLAALKDWVHIATMRDESVDDISDSILQSIVVDGLTKLDLKKRDKVKPVEERAGESDTEDSSMELDEEPDEASQVDLSHAGGCVSYIFSRVSGGVAPAEAVP